MLNDILLITDADGTLLTDDKRILEKDKAAIRELTENGGLFTIATGRSVPLTKPLAEELKLAIPAVILNGAAIYDFNTGRFLWQHTLPDKAREYALIFKERFPSMAVEILRGDEVYVVYTNPLEEEHITWGCADPVRCTIDEIPPDNWLKILLVDEPEIIDECISFAAAKKFDGIHLVRSAPIYYEMLPFGANKGSGLKKLLELTGISGRTTVAAGDFMNDIEMLLAADIGVAVKNAEDAVKISAKWIVCDNNSGAVFEIVEKLKELI
jgi:Cof subfamily protein (haloacid dehalogenase superfamily)